MIFSDVIGVKDGSIISYCMCGCGSQIENGKRYVRGHNLKKKIELEVPVVDTKDFKVEDLNLDEKIVKDRKIFKISLELGEENPVTISSPLKQNVITMAQKLIRKSLEKGDIRIDRLQ